MAAAAAAAKYQQHDGDTDRPNKVCAETGRRNVRNIHHYPVLSAEWITLVDALNQLARLVQLEGRMPANTKVAETQGRAPDCEGTLWDQEAHENAIRILVEEAKVNLCLRMMNDFKKWQRDPVLSQQTMVEAIRTYEYGQGQLEQKCQQFEESLGWLLWRSFTHVETLQLMDLPLLVEHISQVIEHACISGFDHAGKAKMQEHVVLRFFSSLMKHSENLNSAELLARTREANLVMLVTRMILGSGSERPSDCFSADILLSLAEGLSALADNEDFQPAWESFFSSSEEKAQFLELEAKLVMPIIEDNQARKKDLRPLLDFFGKIRKRP